MTNSELQEGIYSAYQNLKIKNQFNFINKLKKGGQIKDRKDTIHIKDKNKGKFTASAKAAGKSVQEYAKSVLSNPNATPLQRRRANFARNSVKWKHANGGTILKMQLAGKMPGTKSQYNNVTQIYQALVDKGVTPQAALDLTNQKVAEKGWTGFATGDNKKYPNAQSFAQHLIDWHSRMYPDSLKAQNFQQYYDGIQKNAKYMYNSEKGYNGYKKDLLLTRPGVKKRINYYRATQGLGPLALVNLNQTNDYSSYA